MSLSEILVPNTYNLFANSVTSVSSGSKSFSAKLLASAGPITLATYTISGWGNAIANPAFNASSGVYTIPSTGDYNFNAGILVTLTGGSTGGQTGFLLTLVNASNVILASASLNINLIASAIYSGVMPIQLFATLQAGTAVRLYLSEIVLPGGTPNNATLVVNQNSWFNCN